MPAQCPRNKNLCDSCELSTEFPECLPEDSDAVSYGNSVGNDNITNCPNFIERK